MGGSRMRGAAEAYQRWGGERRSALPDFCVGAHAAVLEAPLLTLEVHHMWSGGNASITHGWVKRSAPLPARPSAHRHR